MKIDLFLGRIFLTIMIFTLQNSNVQYSPFKNQNSVSSVFTIKCPVCGLTCLMFVMPSVCLSRVCYVQGLLCLGFVLSRVCYVQCLSCLRFVLSRVCCVQGLLCIGFVVSRVCYVQYLLYLGFVLLGLVCLGFVCLGLVMAPKHEV